MVLRLALCATATGCPSPTDGGHDGQEIVLEPAEHAKPLAFNQLAAERLREAATLLEHQGDNPFRVAAYRR
jgi:hypothetical protein